ncbi:MAG TPA: LamG-like jellyroll fold domain-containing protein, partial [Planctomycetota bacterium]|nr:LamG-like jellyroll fold domain-containing protein [Planctomycetota bacterium]
DAALSWKASRPDLIESVSIPDPVRAKNFAVRATVWLGEGTRVWLALVDRDGAIQSGALLSASGAQLITPDETVAAKGALPLEPGRWYDVALVLEKGQGRVYVDGELACEALSGLKTGPGWAQLKFRGQSAFVKKVAMRALE